MAYWLVGYQDSGREDWLSIVGQVFRSLVPLVTSEDIKVGDALILVRHDGRTIDLAAWAEVINPQINAPEQWENFIAVRGDSEYPIAFYSAIGATGVPGLTPPAVGQAIRIPDIVGTQLVKQIPERTTFLRDPYAQTRSAKAPLGGTIATSSNATSGLEAGAASSPSSVFPQVASTHRRIPVTPAEKVTETCDAISPAASRGLRHLIRAAAYMADNKPGATKGVVSPACLIYTLADAEQHNVDLDVSPQEASAMQALGQLLAAAPNFAQSRASYVGELTLPGVETQTFPLGAFNLSSRAETALKQAGRIAQNRKNQETTIADLVLALAESNSERISRIWDGFRADPRALSNMIRKALILPPLTPKQPPPSPDQPEQIRKQLQGMSPPPSVGLVNVLLAAGAIALGRQPMAGELSTATLALAAIECCGAPGRYGFNEEEQDDAAAFWPIMAASPAYAAYRHGFAALPSWPPEPGPLPKGTITITENAIRSLNAAAVIANKANARQTQVTALIRALFDTVLDSPLTIRLLRNIEVEAGDLRDHFAQRIAERKQTAYFRPHSDLDTDADLLGIDGDAQTLARFIASQRTTPPFAIGLFGDWGHGKSFFAKRVKAHIDHLAGQARTNTGPDYHGHVCQVEFNAWHYIETNLWASLVDHIVASLDRFMSGHSKETGADRRAALLARLDDKHKSIEAAEDRVRAAEEKEAQAKLADAEAQHALELQKQQPEPELDWGKLRQEVHASLSTDQTKAITEACKDLGCEDSATDLGKLQSLYCSVRTTVGQVRQAYDALRRVRWLWYGGLVATALLATVGVVLWQIQHAFAALGFTAVLPLGTLATKMASGLLAAKRVATHASSLLAKVNDMTKVKRSAAQELANSLNAARQTAEAEAQSARQALDQAIAEREQAKTELRDATAAMQLRRFFAERMEEDFYGKHLGLVATVRRDFERMTQLLVEHRDERDELTPKQRADLPQLDRVVLYIDDLDRCPPAKVMEVLQAIHLLLTFKLFVVVVAVDVRWLIRSLQKEHEFLAEPPRTNGEQAANHATAADYLEKIFQIPYWVRPMATEAAEDYVTSLLSTPEERQAPPKPSLPERKAEAGTMPADETPQPEGKGTKTEIKTPAPDDEQDEGGSEWAEASTDQTGDMLAPIRQTPIELALARKLAGQLGGSPRRTKRFANLYMLVKMGVPAARRATFANTDDYRCTLVLLALITGLPRNAGRVLDVIGECGGDLDADLVRETATGIADLRERERARKILEIAAENHLPPPERIMTWLPRVRRHVFAADLPDY